MTEGNQDQKVEKMMSDANIKLTVREAADRVLTVLCAMTGGDTTVAINKEDLMAECRRVGILRMSESEFNEYLIKTQQTLGNRQS